MQQLEFKWFWPLQEQIPLDLDDCLIPKGWTVTSKIIDRDYLISSSNVLNTINSGSTGILTINTDEVVFHTKRPQSFFQRWFFGLLGLRVEKV